MEQIIESRELLRINGLWGTCHRASATFHCAETNRVGIIFLNGLYATRAANGDAAVHWATAVAERGYTSFRFDLPGFGDSTGDPPPNWLSYINAGGYATVVADILHQVSRQYQLPGVVIAGHCAGAVSAIYAAAFSGLCRGLVLMDPYFNLPQADLSGAREQLNLWARRSRLGGALSSAFGLIKQGRRILRRNDLPANANLKLLRCWKQVASSGLPILILRAPGRGSAGVKPRPGEFDYLNHIMNIAGSRSKIIVNIVDGANHSFSDQHGRVAVPELMNSWMRTSVSFATTSSKVVVMPEVGDRDSDAISATRGA